MDERRAQLIALGVRLFGTRAYDEVSIDAIAEEAGVSKGLLYHYFGSKRAFHLACVADAAGGLLHALASLPPELTGPDRARVSLSAYLDFVEEHGLAYAAMVNGAVGADPEVAAVLNRSRAAILARLLEDNGMSTPRPMFELALRHYIGGVEAVALDWHERRHLSRAQLLDFLTAQVRATLEVALRFDPDAPLELDPEG